MQNGNRADQVHAAALVDGQISLHGCLIQCIIESSSESLSRQTGRAHILAQRLSDLKPVATNGFEEQVRTPRADTESEPMIHQMKMAYLLMDDG